MFDRQSLLARAVAWRSDDETDSPCGCDTSFETASTGGRDARTSLHVDATACPAGGALADAPDCRRTVVEALTERDADAITVRTRGVERQYTDEAVALLVAAGRFAERVAHYDEGLAHRATTDPLRAAHEATGRAGPVARLAAETGLALGAERVADTGGSYETALRAAAAPPDPGAGPRRCRPAGCRSHRRCR